MLHVYQPNENPIDGGNKMPSRAGDNERAATTAMAITSVLMTKKYAFSPRILRKYRDTIFQESHSDDHGEAFRSTTRKPNIDVPLITETHKAAPKTAPIPIQRTWLKRDAKATPPENIAAEVANESRTIPTPPKVTCRIAFTPGHPRGPAKACLALLNATVTAME